MYCMHTYTLPELAKELTSEYLGQKYTDLLEELWRKEQTTLNSDLVYLLCAFLGLLIFGMNNDEVKS